jgi:cystathionine beta-lyase
MAKSKSEGGSHRPATRLVRGGRDPALTGPFINPPVVHASTVLFPTAGDMEHHRQRYSYGRHGTPTSEALEMAVADLEGSEGAVLLPSGLAAATLALLSCLSAGDELLLPDSVYGPVRRFVGTTLKRLGVTSRFYDPALGAGVEALFTEKTRAVYTEVPGSVTFEMQDLPAIAEAAHRHGALVLCDNTWATPLYFPALARGADISIIAATKYLCGHSDAMLGTVAASGAALKKVKETHRDLGLFTGPDDMFLALRGMRTLAVRLERHQRSAMTVAKWLADRSEVARVLYPPLASDPGHALWKRDMTGGSGLFSVIFRGWTEAQAKQFMDGLSLFGIGASWGGFESLITFHRPQTIRTAVPWQAEGPLVRIHIGLEEPADLIADMEASFAAVAAAA